MPIEFPDKLQRDDQTKPLTEQSEIQGGALGVANVAARDAIPEAKRALRMVVSYNDGVNNITKRYDGADVLDANWTNESNWSFTTNKQSIVTKSENYTILSTDFCILADGSTATVDISTPDVALNVGKVFNIKAIDVTNQVRLISTELIDGQSSVILSLYNNITVISDGSNWHIL